MLGTITTVTTTTTTVTTEQVLTGLGIIFIIIAALFLIIRRQKAK